MNPPKVKKFTRAKNLDPTKVQEFISGAESGDKPETEQTPIENNPPEHKSETVGPSSVDNSVTTTQSIQDTPSNWEGDAGKAKYPWEDANERVLKGVNLRLTEVQWAKLRFIVDNTPFSIQRYIMNLLEPEMEKSIKKIQDSLKWS